jgi:hypothetical protein
VRPRIGSPFRPIAIVATALAAALTVSATAAPLSAARGPATGTPIEIHGTVTTADGRPLEGIEVRFVAQGSKLDWHRLMRRSPPEIAVDARSDARGAFQLAWRTVAGYGRFRVEAAQVYRRDRSDARQLLAQIDITPRLASGGPVVVALTIEDTSFVDDLRLFLASLVSEEERAAYAEFGRPDRVDTFGGVGSGGERSWWYFRLGTALRWSDGRLVERTTFDPVRPF